MPPLGSDMIWRSSLGRNLKSRTTNPKIEKKCVSPPHFSAVGVGPPFGENDLKTLLRCFPLLSALLSRREIKQVREGSKNSVSLQNGCACAPELIHPPFPAVLAPEPSSGTGADLGSEFPSPKLIQGVSSIRVYHRFHCSSVDLPRKGYQPLQILAD